MTEKDIPRGAIYSSITEAVPSKRVSSVIVPSSGPDCEAAGRFVINIPPTGYFDASRSYLTFNLQITKQNTTYPTELDPARGHYACPNGLKAIHSLNAAEDAPERKGVGFANADNQTGIRIPDGVDPNNVFRADNVNVHKEIRNEVPPPVKPDRLQNGIHSLFKRIVIRSQTAVVIEDIQEYNLLCQIQQACLMAEGYNTSTGSVEGYGTDYDLAELFHKCTQNRILPSAVGKANSSQNIPYVISNDNVREIHNHSDIYGYGKNMGSVRFAMQPLLGILSTGRYLPLLFMGGIQIEFHLEDSRICFVRGYSTRFQPYLNISRRQEVADGPVHAVFPSDGVHASYPSAGATYLGVDDASLTAARLVTTGNGNIYPLADHYRQFTYKLSNIEYHCDMVNFSPEYDDALARMIQSKGVRIPYVTAVNSHNSILLDGSTNISIQNRSTSVRNVFVVFRRNWELNNNAVWDKASLENFYKDGITSYQFRVGTRVMPNQPVRCDGMALEAYQNLLLTFNKIPEDKWNDGDDKMEITGMNLPLEDYSRELKTIDDLETLSVAMAEYFGYTPVNSGYYPIAIGSLTPKKEISRHFNDVGSSMIKLNQYDKFPFENPLLNPKYKFIIAQNFNEHKNHKSGLNTAATALPIELTLTTNSSVREVLSDTAAASGAGVGLANLTHRYDAFVVADRMLEIQCGGALTVIH